MVKEVSGSPASLQHNHVVQEPKKDLIIECADGKKLSVSSQLLIAHSSYYEAMLIGTYREMKDYHFSACPAVQNAQFTKKILMIVTHFFQTNTLPKKASLKPEDMLVLNDTIDFLQFKVDGEKEKFRNLLLDKIKKEFLIRDNALSWYVAAMQCGNFPMLRSAAIDAFKGAIIPADFLKTIAWVKENLPTTEQLFFLRWFVPYCQFDHTTCDQEQSRAIFPTIRDHGIPTQKAMFMNAVSGSLTDENLFTIFESNGEACIEGLTKEETLAHCVPLLFSRVQQWLHLIGQDGDFAGSGEQILGTKVKKKFGIGTKRAKLPSEAVSKLARFAKFAPFIKDQPAFLKSVDEKLVQRERNWVLSRINVVT